MLKKFILLCWVSSLLPVLTVKAQSAKATLSGKIIDRETQKSLSGSTVILIEITDSTRKTSTISDGEGNFHFSSIRFGNYAIKVSSIGYKPLIAKQISINKSHITLPAFSLITESGKQLAEVSITSQKAFTEQKLDRMVVNVGAMISNTGASAMDALNQSPGVEVTDDGVTLRGREGVEVFINDKPTHLSGKDLIDYLKTLPAGTLDKIEIMPIPPALYNAGGTAGVINIKTKRATTNGFNGSLTVNYGEGRRAKSNNSFNFNYKTGKFNVFGNGGYVLNNSYYSVNWNRQYLTPGPLLSPVLQQYNYETSTTQSFSYRLGFDYDISKRTAIGMLFNGVTVPYTEHGNYQLHFSQLTGQADSAVSVASELRQHSSNNAVNFNLRHQFQHLSRELNINLDYLNHNVTSNQTSISDTYLSNGTFKSDYTLLSANSFPVKVYGVKADYDDQFMAGIKLTVGLQSTYSTRNNTGNYSNQVKNIIQLNDSLTNRFESRENINSAYISLKKEYKRLSAQAGLRAENTNATANAYTFNNSGGSMLKFNYTDLFPTAYLAYKLDSSAVNTINLSIGRRINRPNYSDLNPSVFFFDKYTSYKGNPLLQPAYSTNMELSYNHGGYLTLGLLYNTTKDQIIQAYTLVQQAIIFNSFNLNRVTSYGGYVNPSITVTQWLSLNAYLELTRSNYQGTVGDGVIIDNQITSFRSSGSSQLKFKHGFIAEISGLYRGKRTFGQGVYQPLWQLNSSIQKKLFNDKASINLTARDIFHTNIINRSVLVQGVQLSRIITNDTQQVSIAFSYKFGTAGKSRSHSNGIEDEASRAGAN